MRSLLFLAPLLAAQAAHAQCPSWSAEFANPVVEGPVFASASLDGGARVALGGDFVKAGGLTVNRVALWDGTSFQPLGAGFDGPLRALVVFDAGSGPELYAGGEFTQSGGAPRPGVARWDGAQWAAVGSGISGVVRALHAWNGSLWAGGDFVSAGGAPASNVARWDGSAWSAVGGGTAGTVETIHDYANQLVVGGSFLSAGGVPARNIARWTGVTWAIVGNGTNGRVVALLGRDEGPVSRLYVGGTFTTAGGFPMPHLARWDGSAWSPVGAGPDGGVSALLDHQAPGDVGARLYVGGSFAEAGGEPAPRIAAWDGAQWSAVGAGLGGETVETLVADASGRVLAGGDCTLAEDGGELGLLAWDGDAWDALAQGVTPYYVTSMWYVDDGSEATIWIGGLFEQAGGVLAPGTAAWDGDRWTLPPGAMRPADFATFDDGSGPALHAAGTDPDLGVSGVWRFDGTSWSLVGPSFGPRRLTVFDDGTGPALYAGGRFESIGGETVRHVARWDGSAWVEVGGGLAGDGDSGGGNFGTDVRAMHVFDDGSGPALYVVGTFSTAGGVACRNVARWDGAAWSALGEGLGSTYPFLPFPRCMEVYDDGTGEALYVGGSFVESGAETVSRWVRWDPVAQTFSDVGGVGSSTTVNAMEVFDDGSGAGPVLLAANYDGILRWDGQAVTTWATIGTNTNFDVDRLVAVPGGTHGPRALWVSGNFDSMDGVPSSLVARYDTCESAGAPFCFGDGSGTTCPCGNAGLEGNGCATSFNPDGAHLRGVGTPSVSADTVLLEGTGTSSSFVTYFQGTERVDAGAGAVFGDGLRCAGGTTIRLRTLLAVDGASSYPEPGDLSVSERGQVPPGGGTRTYQAWFRNALEFCTPSTFNLSNGLEIVWTP